MIYTVTFNPALDYVVRVDNLKLGEVNRSNAEAVFYGGKGINVSTVLKNIGVDSVALGFVAGFTGREIENGVKALGVDTDFITLDKGMSRINVKLKAEEETEINGQGPDIPEADIEKLFAQLDKLTAGDCLDKDIEIVVDATKDLLLNVLKYHPFLIKPNNHELGEMFGVELKTDEEITEYAMKLLDMGAKNVLISMAGDGAILVTESREVFRMGVPKGKVVNSVGAGDSMVAGFIASYFKDHDYLEALKFGTATGSATAFSEGLAEADIVYELYSRL